MYEPIKDGIEKTLDSVIYTENKPPEELSSVVHCYWELKTKTPLPDCFFLHALPDACVNILFNQMDAEIAGVTALSTKFEVLNLGKNFHYIGIQFLPGAWQGDRKEIKDEYIGSKYTGTLPLIEYGQAMKTLSFTDKQMLLSKLVWVFLDSGLLIPNELTQKILTNIDDIKNVADMSNIAGVSPRQLQRKLKNSTGFSPHDLLKVVRLQNSFKKSYLMSYSDQSHFIKSFQKITGYTPMAYAKKYGV